MRAMLIVNPNATAIRRGVGELLATAIADHARVEVVPTDYRGHATELAAGARKDGVDLVVAFGGDGTINETVQGLLGNPDLRDDTPVPRFAAIPGGYGNTFARNLGFPLGVRGSARKLSEALGENRTRTVGLGLAVSPSGLTPTGDLHRWVCFSAGLGFDAEIIRTIERIRSRGRRINGIRYVSATAEQALLRFDRRTPHLVVTDPLGREQDRAFMVVIQNTSPYAYVNRMSFTLTPKAGFDTGLDLFALYDMSLRSVVDRAARMALGRMGDSTSGATVAHDLPVVRIESDRPIGLQIDGEGIGMVERLECRSVPDALRVYV